MFNNITEKSVIGLDGLKVDRIIDIIRVKQGILEKINNDVNYDCEKKFIAKFMIRNVNSKLIEKNVTQTYLEIINTNLLWFIIIMIYSIYQETGLWNLLQKKEFLF